ncbi:MAG TPA: carboxypeptidase regulatory-like domain-containing protein [Terriglobales bacterium]|nr:carboxypeptidase regulatory-like domain-containing protein [Terriglobales bacterium]
MQNRKSRFAAWLGVLACMMLLMTPAWAQSTISAGSIQGTVTDPSGAVLSNANVTISNEATGLKITRTTTDSGAFNSGPLAPGNYTVRVETKGFQAMVIPVTVQIGSTSAVNPKLQVGSETQTVEVSTSALAVNTEQATVQGVLNTEQIENLPVNGRNFLDLAQLEPGVQIQDGGNFDPTKNGFSSVSFGGRAGRAARITVDGIDISDENVGTTTQNLSAGAISEFQISQSTLDLSTELTSSGAVNVLTKSGTNNVHGDAFYLFRDKSVGFANFPAGYDTPFQRNHFGGSLGGPVVKDNLFFFVNAERVKQDQLNPVIPSPQFTGVPPGYQAPYRDSVMMGKLDWNAPHGVRLFYKFNYNYNSTTRSDLPTYQPFSNKNNTPSHGVGADFSTGNYIHSIRYGYLHFHNQIADAVNGNPSVYNPLAEWGIAGRIGGFGTPMRFGPNRLAPQETIQRNHQIKYDGSRLWKNHLFRYGVDYNKIGIGGLASFYGVAPEARTSNSSAAQALADSGPFAGGRSNPLNYALTAVVLGNGLGFGSENPAYGFPGGGFFPHRFAFYFGDSWKVRPNFTLTAGVRYQRESGRTSSDLDPVTCDQIDSSLFSSVPCTGSQQLLDQWGAGFGDRVHQPNNNWGPQLGFAWDPSSNGKFVIRGGGGIYYENTVINNTLFDRAERLTSGLFNNVPLVCGVNGNALPVPGLGTVTSFPYNGGTVNIADMCSLRMGEAAPQIAALQAWYQAQTLAAGAQGNALFVGNNLGAFAGVVDPHFKTPYSVQMNLGFQREIREGLVLSADFLRNVGLRFLMPVEANHDGDVRFFNKTAAQNAIDATLAHYGVATIDQAIAAGATIADFADNGLDRGATYLAGFPASAFGLDPNNGAAFAGINPGVGTGGFLTSTGRSTYTALQMKLIQRATNPLPGIAQTHFQVSYSLSRFNNSIGADQDFGAGNAALDNAVPSRYYGPSSLDRTHQFSFGGSFQINRGPQMSFIGHIYSPLSLTPLVPVDPTGASGEIFRTDFTGDGTVGDVLPGANVGTYGRDVNGSGINRLIDAYNSGVAGTLTPAGQVLVQNGLFTQSQLVALGGVAPTINRAPEDQLGLGWLKTVDLRLSWPISLTEKVKLHPSFAVFNLFNFANYNTSTAQIMTPQLDGEAPGISGTSKSNVDAINALRAGIGTGVNSFAAPRQMEFGLRLTF